MRKAIGTVAVEAAGVLILIGLVSGMIHGPELAEELLIPVFPLGSIGVLMHASA